MPAAPAISAIEAPPRPFERSRMVRGGLKVGALIALLGLVAAFAPGLGEVRNRLAHADPTWVAAAVALQVLSCGSYVLLFRPLFKQARDRTLSWATTQRVAWSALAIGSIVPASGAAGLAYGGWALAREGVETETVARRSVAFFLIKGSVNFVAVALLGSVMALGLVGPPVSLWLTAFPAALSVAAIAAVVLLTRLGEGDADATGKLPRARRTLVAGTREAIAIVARRDPLVIAGALGYWIFDNAVLWAAFHAFGAHVDVSVILLGYLVGQLGGLLPIPGGVGGIDLGLIGMLVAFGAPAAATAAAVLVYRVILFWIPLLGGAVALGTTRGARTRTRPAAHPAYATASTPASSRREPIPSLR
ncbi:YbhN family protein [Conexibacter sp. JD483]|uniref:lysylphosphatidylglycerol synthase transmembrane domain-containing protein n=1 Tax=unclassified Conexibacter TaxID=2627773 RepID=UPI0027245298|nr:MULTISPECIES: YbhN family protein [unclassified Conexibacter]MDO8188442.1 YbhN family protein [Conexibacter sp. CPCC 205706]MDO8199197.1 YbhN family protein [Conexibacter sp. CPCC 205762]MDR9372341.1 YbhN family protein [Conexibacter sp. JD483]